MTFLISMVPVLELRGAIPIGVAHGLDYRIAIAVSILGNLVPVPFIVLFIRKIFAWLRTKSERLNGFVTRMEQRALKKSDTVRRARFWGLFIFVAIPLPGTGAWTGSLAAALMKMPIKDALFSVIGGTLTYDATNKRSRWAHKIRLFPAQDTTSQGKPTCAELKKPDIVAPGSRIVSLAAGSSYQAKSGTSMSTPIVAGCIALLLEKYPDLTNREIKLHLRNTALDLGYSHTRQGWGLIQCDRMLSTPPTRL